MWQNFTVQESTFDPVECYAYFTFSQDYSSTEPEQK